MRIRLLVVTLIVCAFAAAEAQTPDDLQRQINTLQQQLNALRGGAVSEEGYEGGVVVQRNVQGAAPKQEAQKGQVVMQEAQQGRVVSGSSDATVRQQPAVQLRPVETGRSASLKIGKPSRGVVEQQSEQQPTRQQQRDINAQAQQLEQRLQVLREQQALEQSERGGQLQQPVQQQGGYYTPPSQYSSRPDYSSYYGDDWVMPGQRRRSGGRGGSYGGVYNSIAVKTNLAYLIAATPSLGVEFGLGQKTSLDIAFAYNGWGRAPQTLAVEPGTGKLYDPATGTVYKERQMDHTLGKAEIRLWLLERFEGQFLGFHALYSKYDVYGVKVPLLFEKDTRYDGSALGFGLSYGYRWDWNQRWGLEMSLGVGMMNLDYDKKAWHPNNPTNVESGRFKKTYFGPTNIGVRVYFMLK